MIHSLGYDAYCWGTLGQFRMITPTSQMNTLNLLLSYIPCFASICFLRKDPVEVEEGDEAALPEGSLQSSEKSPSADHVAGLDKGMVATAASADAGKSTYDVRPDGFITVLVSCMYRTGG